MISIIIIHYYTPNLLENLVRSIFDNNDLELRDLEILIINNGGVLSPARLLDFPDTIRIIEPGMNLGYAGGINYGLNRAKGNIIFVMNTDLYVHRGSLNALIRALTDYDIVGPKFYWDDNCQIILPPTEGADFGYSLLKIFHGVNSFVGRLRMNIWWKRMYRHLTATTAFATVNLSGALLGFTREAYEKIGPFDERFRLYYEESDWLLRAKKLDLSTGFIPDSRVTHYYNQSAKEERSAERWFEDSFRLFTEKHFSGIERMLINYFSKLTSVMSTCDYQEVVWHREKTDKALPFIPISLPMLDLLSNRCFYLQISPFLSFIPSAVQQLKDSMSLKEWSMSPEVWEKLAPGTYYYRLVDLDGKQVLPSPIE